MLNPIFENEDENAVEGYTETVHPLEGSNPVVPVEYSGSSAHCIAKETGIKEDELDPTTATALNLRYRIFNDTSIRMVLDDQKNVWFVADDICKLLGYTQSTSKVISVHCSKVADSKDMVEGETELAHKITVDTKGGKQAMIAINEPDLYRLIMRSRMPDARKFEKWVVEDVLPTIRKTGKYAVKRKLDTLPKASDSELAKEAPAQLELFPRMISISFPQPLTDKINSTKKKLSEEGQTFPTNKDFLAFLVSKALEDFE